MFIAIFGNHQIRLWKSKSPREFRTFPIIIQTNVDLCPVTADDINFRGRRNVDPVTAYVDDLWPFSDISAGVSVLNGAHMGEMSDVIEFNTSPSGLMGKPHGNEQPLFHYYTTEAWIQFFNWFSRVFSNFYCAPRYAIFWDLTASIIISLEDYIIKLKSFSKFL